MAVLQSGETFATGMVKPKTTALFFDKLWVHPALIKGFVSDDLEPYRVPPELCVTQPMAAQHYYDSWQRQRTYMTTKWAEISKKDVSEALRRLNLETWDLHSIFEVEAIQHFGTKEPPQVWRRLREQLPPAPSSWAGDWEFYMSTQQRNKAIAFIVRLYAERGVTLTPIYLARSEFEEVTKSERAGLELCLDQIPTVLESELSWKQVLDVRQDKKARAMLDRLRRWFSLELLGKNEDDIRNILGQRLDDYQWAIKKHGLKTVVAGITSIIPFVASSTAFELLTGNPLAAVLGGVTIGSGIAAWVATRLIEKEDIRRDEVAYIYEVQKLTGH